MITHGTYQDIFILTSYHNITLLVKAFHSTQSICYICLYKQYTMKKEEEKHTEPSATCWDFWSVTQVTGSTGLPSAYLLQTINSEEESDSKKTPESNQDSLQSLLFAANQDKIWQGQIEKQDNC